MMREAMCHSLRFSSAAVPGDAMNPNTWTVRRLDTGESLIVLAVDDVDGSGMTFDLYTLRKFQNALISHRIESDTLRTPSDVVISAPNTFDFRGAEKHLDAVAPSELVDIANPPFANDSIAGTLQVTDSGDYAVESGTALLKKLIIRRLTTSAGEFFYMTDYGVGLRLKEPLPIADMPKLKALIRLQLLREPEIASLDVGLTLTSEGILRINLIVTLRQTNQQVPVTLDVPQG